MNTPDEDQEKISTWSQDVKRGLNNAISMQARSQRIAERHAHRYKVNLEFEHALFVIRSHMKTDKQLVRLLNVASAAILVNHGPSSYMHEFVEKLDELADEVTA